jgi:hypothetical protein
MSNRIISYTINWNQPYSLKQISVDMSYSVTEMLLEKSGYVEALEVIDRIRSMK